MSPNVTPFGADRSFGHFSPKPVLSYSLRREIALAGERRRMKFRFPVKEQLPSQPARLPLFQLSTFCFRLFPNIPKEPLPLPEAPRTPPNPKKAPPLSTLAHRCSPKYFFTPRPWKGRSGRKFAPPILRSRVSAEDGWQTSKLRYKATSPESPPRVGRSGRR